MPQAPKTYLITITIMTITAVLAIGLAVGGSLYLSIYEANRTSQRLCGAFAYFTHKPPPPLNTPLKRTEQGQYVKLLQFEGKLGCHP